uniref:Uncharacterized protein n=1 Tax=Timema monikensis TaxID=170555 RepID=A0A7R9EED9_9NEOP|nr:unnamed protein product [Timema monikensis]
MRALHEALLAVAERRKNNGSLSQDSVGLSRNKQHEPCTMAVGGLPPPYCTESQTWSYYIYGGGYLDAQLKPTLTRGMLGKCLEDLSLQQWRALSAMSVTYGTVGEGGEVEGEIPLGRQALGLPSLIHPLNPLRPASMAWIAKALVVLSSAAEDGEIETDIGKERTYKGTGGWRERQTKGNNVKRDIWIEGQESYSRHFAQYTHTLQTEF